MEHLRVVYLPEPHIDLRHVIEAVGPRHDRVATPHTAGNRDGTLRRRAEFCAQNVHRIAAGLEPEYRIA
jgi:phosphoglycerate dehydrogenase-like enzyme